LWFIRRKRAPDEPGRQVLGFDKLDESYGWYWPIESVEMIAMESARCMKCGASTLVAGRVLSGFMFLANNTRIFSPQEGVPLCLDSNAGFACLSCGHVGTLSVDPNRLRAFIVKHGNELARQQLECFEAGPYHGLPESAEAHAAADRVVEIDFLVAIGRGSEATRRYRGLMHTTWDRAIDALRGWSGLTREEKLTRVGWCPKEATASKEAESGGHPLRDRWLDR
jgi:hypothetical protein